MRALKTRNVRWQAGVTSKLAQDDAMLELATANGCTMLSNGFESISQDTLKSVHKHLIVLAGFDRSLRCRKWSESDVHRTRLARGDRGD
jgi:hypothetical protein